MTKIRLTRGLYCPCSILTTIGVHKNLSSEFPNYFANSMFRQRMFTVGVIAMHRLLHPNILRYHMDSVRRNPPEVLGIAPNFNSRLIGNCDTQAAVQGLTNVLGFPGSAIEHLIPYFPEYTFYGPEGLERRRRLDKGLLTWKDVRKGRDLFIKGLGVFDINKSWEECSSRRRKEFARTYLRLLRGAVLREAFDLEVKAGRTIIPEGVGSPAESWQIEEIIDSLASSVGLDMLGLINASAPSDFGSFLSKGELRRCLYTGAYSAGLYWLPSVSELQAFGYFATIVEQRYMSMLSNILSKDESSPQRQHLIRYYHFWNHPDNIGSIDELVRVADSPEREFWPGNGEKMNPLQLLNLLRDAKRRESLGPEEMFDYLSELPDHGRCRVLRSNYEICDVADKLNNCARSYISQVRSKRCVLVVLEDKNGAPVALGMRPLSCNWPPSGWTEIRETFNRRPCKETIQEFDKYSIIFRRWHRGVFQHNLPHT